MDTDLLHDPRIACHVVDVAEGRLDPTAAIEFVSDDAHGGIDVFIGRVRASSHGRQCVAIHYDMLDPLALTVFRSTASRRPSSPSTSSQGRTGCWYRTRCARR